MVLDGLLLTVYSHDLFFVCMNGREEERTLMSLLIRKLILLDQGPTCMHLTLISSIKTLFPNFVTLGDRATTDKFCGDKYSFHNFSVVNSEGT